MDPSLRPEDAAAFERLLLASPNSSLLWLQYMAHHLQATQIEQARAVAERALKTISFRWGVFCAHTGSCIIMNVVFWGLFFPPPETLHHADSLYRLYVFVVNKNEIGTLLTKP